jgi:hypothetical protein
MIRRAVRGVAPSLVWAASACGSGSGGGGGGDLTGVSSSKKLVDLTAAEKGRVCDWMVGKAGSYGTPGTCDRTKAGSDFPLWVYDDQADCIDDSPDATFTDCQATVSQLETCVNALPACASLGQAASTSACSILDGC